VPDSPRIPRSGTAPERSALHPAHTLKGTTVNNTQIVAGANRVAGTLAVLKGLMIGLFAAAAAIGVVVGLVLKAQGSSMGLIVAIGAVVYATAGAILFYAGLGTAEYLLRTNAARVPVDLVNFPPVFGQVPAYDQDRPTSDYQPGR
jgi:hypothetical protein